MYYQYFDVNQSVALTQKMNPSLKETEHWGEGVINNESIAYIHREKSEVLCIHTLYILNGYETNFFNQYSML